MAGFHVTGIDLHPQKHYCGDRFIPANALHPPVDLAAFDLIWASPPCQRFTSLRSMVDVSAYEDLIEPTRALLVASGRPYIIENVVGAPLRTDLTLCANTFGLRCYRHRIFELSHPVAQPTHQPHLIRVNRKGENRRQHWANGGHMTITGDVGRYCGEAAMGITWMTGHEMSQAIPPCYAQYIATAYLDVL